MQLTRHKFRIEVGSYYNPPMDGAWMVNTPAIYTVVEARNMHAGKAMLEAQYGGQERCRVTWMGPG